MPVSAAAKNVLRFMALSPNGNGWQARPPRPAAAKQITIDTIRPSVCLAGDEAWEKQFLELIQYKEKHGDCNVPQYFQDNRPLGSWVKTQRLNHRDKKLSKDKVSRLNEIGFEWNPQTAKSKQKS